MDLGNGRLRCAETGHEVVAGDEEAYARNKRCRLGLIDHALSHGKSPLNMFSQCLISRSKLVCKLTGDTVNKNEQHIWKHVNGKRFLHRLEQVERGAGTSGKTEKIQVTYKHRRLKEDTDSDDSEFWMLNSSSGSESEQESDEENCKDSHCDAKESEELSERTKRMSIEIGPSSFASRKKKIRNVNLPTVLISHNGPFSCTCITHTHIYIYGTRTVYLKEEHQETTQACTQASSHKL